MQAVILVGGEGRRLRPLTDTRPKPMMPLVDRPMVAHQLDHLRRHGIRDVVFSCGYRPDALETHFGDGSGVGMRLRYVVDPEPLGTAGAVKNAEPLLGDDDLLVLNGDILTDLDLGALREQHVRVGALGTLALTPVPDPSAFGLVRLRPDRAVEAFLEKPRPEELRPGEPFLINAGTYLLDRRFLREIPPATACSIEREVFPAVAARGALYGFPSDAYWRDIGTPDSYLAAHVDVLGGAIVTESPRGDRWLGPGVSLAPDAVVGGGSSLGEGATVEAGARVEASVIGAGALVGPRAELVGAIVGAGARIGEGSRLDPGAVVGDGARIGAGNALPGGVRVATGAHLPPGTLVAP
jgi:mannose-1-phosphate guanylyltransferase